MIECDKYVFERVRWLNSVSDAPNFQETDRTAFFEIVFKLWARSFYAYLCRSVGPSVSGKMSKIVKIQEFALEQKTKVNEHVE